jgi:hypothetical protein
MSASVVFIPVKSLFMQSIIIPGSFPGDSGLSEDRDNSLGEGFIPIEKPYYERW